MVVTQIGSTRHKEPKHRAGRTAKSATLVCMRDISARGRIFSDVGVELGEDFVQPTKSTSVYVLREGA